MFSPLTMKRFKSWILWNLFLFGFLIVGYNYNMMKMSGIVIGISMVLQLIAYVFVITVFSLFNFFPDMELNEKSLSGIKILSEVNITVIIDLMLPFAAYKMGYEKIGIMLGIEMVLYFIGVAIAKNIRRERGI